MPTGNKKIVMFDFDGVLANTLQYSYEIHKKKNNHFTWEQFQDFSNGNFHDGFDKMVREGNFIVTENFFDLYNQELQELSIHDALHTSVVSLSKKYRLVIISSSPDAYIAQFIKKEGLEDCFSDILGFNTHRSKVIKIQQIITKYDVSPESTVFITDSLGDINEASECNVVSIGVT